MRVHILADPLRNDCGIALPTAMIALALLTTLLMAFAVLSRSEPIIASNQALTARARTLAEAGAERAIWALNVASGIPSPMVSTIAPSPYDGSTYLSLQSVGGFFVRVVNGASANERIIDSVGWAPAYSATGYAAGGGPTAHKHIYRAVAKTPWPNPPAALSVRGNLRIQGSALIDSRDASCGNKDGTFTAGDTTNGGTVYGYGDNHDSNAPPDRVRNVPLSTFDNYIFSNNDLNNLRNLAKCCGTYLQGDQAFNASNPFPRNGLIFVDTTAGTNISCTGTWGQGDQVCTPSIFPAVRITGNAAPTGYSEFRGWLVVNGAIEWDGNTRARGLVYAVNDISYAGTETIYGAVISQNIRDTSSTNIDSDVTGNSTVQWACDASSGAGTLPTGFFSKAGSYREVAD